MILCALATTVPLIVGSLNNSLSVSIYGGIAGYLLALNDHLGDLKHRLLVLLLTFLLLISAVALGFSLADRPILALMIVLGFVYWLGIFGNEGAETERAILFSALGMVIALFSGNLATPLILQAFIYSSIGFTCVLFGAPLLVATGPWTSRSNHGIRESLGKSLTWKLDRHIHAVSYTLTVLIAMILAYELRSQRGYWIVITAMLVMKPDRRLSVYVTLQRLIGTFFAVAACEAVFFYLGNAMEIWRSFPLILSISGCAFAIPLALKRSYLAASFLITIVVLFLLQLASSPAVGPILALLRLRATLIGCALSLLGTFVSLALTSLWQSRRSAP